MSNLLKHAKVEFAAAGYKEEDGGPNKWMKENVLELLKVFSEQGHSGMSATHCIELFTKLARYEPLVPLTGEDEEWEKIGPGEFQNKRCSHVFKDSNRFNGQAYDIQGKIFVEPNGVTYTNSDSIVTISFPYLPSSEFVYTKNALH